MGWVVSSKIICWCPIPDTCECDLNWNWGLCRCNQVKMKSCWSEMGPKSNYKCLYKVRVIWRQRILKEDGPVTRQQRLEWSSCKPKNAEDCCEPPESSKRQGRILLQVFRGSMWLKVSCFCPFCLQNSERINFCCLKSFNLVVFIYCGPRN